MSSSEERNGEKVYNSQTEGFQLSTAWLWLLTFTITSLQWWRKVLPSFNPLHTLASWFLTSQKYQEEDRKGLREANPPHPKWPWHLSLRDKRCPITASQNMTGARRPICLPKQGRWFWKHTTQDCLPQSRITHGKFHKLLPLQSLCWRERTLLLSGLRRFPWKGGTRQHPSPSRPCPPRVPLSSWQGMKWHCHHACSARFTAVEQAKVSSQWSNTCRATRLRERSWLLPAKAEESISSLEMSIHAPPKDWQWKDLLSRVTVSHNCLPRNTTELLWRKGPEVLFTCSEKNKVDTF